MVDPRTPSPYRVATIRISCLFLLVSIHVVALSKLMLGIAPRHTNRGSWHGSAPYKGTSASRCVGREEQAPGGTVDNHLRACAHLPLRA
jgi:hypothetical protein